MVAARATDKSAAIFKESQREIVTGRDSDARGYAHSKGRPLRTRIVGQPESPALREIPAIEPPIDLHRLTQAGGPTGDVPKIVRTATPLHQGDTIDRLQGSNQHRAGDAHRFRDHIQAVFGVNGIHVSDPGATEHGRILVGPSSVGMTRGIFTRQIRFGFDNSPQADSVSAAPNQQPPE
jgi:hypothetical protein